MKKIIFVSLLMVIIFGSICWAGPLYSPIYPLEGSDPTTFEDNLSIQSVTIRLWNQSSQIDYGNNNRSYDYFSTFHLNNMIIPYYYKSVVTVDVIHNSTLDNFFMIINHNNKNKCLYKPYNLRTTQYTYPNNK